MARDADGKPHETRGRRSISQRSRDLSERLRAMGGVLEGSPRLLETFLSVGLATGIVYLLRPQITVTKYVGEVAPGSNVPPGVVFTPTYVIFRGQPIGLLKITYPDRYFMEIFAIASSLIASGGSGGDIGSIVAPIGFGLAFQRFIQTMFPGAPASSEVWAVWDLAAGHIQGPDEPLPKLGGDVTLTVYTKIILPRYLKALMVAAFFVFLLRYVKNIGGT